MPIKVVVDHQPNGVNEQRRMQRIWERQPPPYVNILPFEYSDCHVSGTGIDWEGNISYPDQVSVGLGSPSRDRSDLVAATCYGRLVDQLHDTSQWANNLHEANGAISGAAARILQIARFAGFLRKGNIRAAAKSLAVPVPKSLKGKKAKAKAFGDQFLEFHFGWVPLAQDIHSAMQTLSKPNFDSRKINASAAVSDLYYSRTTDAAYPYKYTSSESLYALFRCRMGVTVRISNPNAALANALGLINPASVAWEAVPFSFVADWFGNIGQFLSSATDFVGFDVSRGYTTASTEIRSSGTGIIERVYNPPRIDYYAQEAGHLIRVNRSVGIQYPSLVLKPFKGFSLTRGVTAISLLLQKMK